MLVIKAGFHKILVRKANRKNPDQTDLGLPSLFRLFFAATTIKILEQ